MKMDKLAMAQRRINSVSCKLICRIMSLMQAVEMFIVYAYWKMVQRILGGDALFGQLGHGDDEHKLVPTQISVKNVKFKFFVIGISNSCLIDESDNLYVFGANFYGQLCIGDEKDKLIPTKIEKKNVLDVSLGNQYSFLMVAEKQKKQKDDASDVNI